MTIKELKEVIANLPDDMKVRVGLDVEYDIHDGCASDWLSTEIVNGVLYITADFDWN